VWIVLIIVHLCSACYCIYNISIVIIILLPSFYTLAGSFFGSPRFAYPSLRLSHFANQVFGEDHPYCKEPEFPCLLIHLTFGNYVFLSIVIMFDLFFLDWNQPSFCSIIHKIMLFV